ncbi:hypothetical protein CONPUDRAFT_159699 [Coniophora puteana RWD-64-598 SS2]|uniref:DUF6532 domain-containing protein n=1 Tax=Coniophora puteana (strain RWD-64-598) TaxID=741705 RepID=A0A5M3M6F8_CONPW|nr:uncharacterized protein CONPUDRAFT_159699 [Coniophora puteana RWD-64-598 SS2]EIW74928.1 hypothetical protein CONPUDRAFT_159699 [Coniophora puteana RWD-64-598 SS2]
MPPISGRSASALADLGDDETQEAGEIPTSGILSSASRCNDGQQDAEALKKMQLEVDSMRDGFRALQEQQASTLLKTYRQSRVAPQPEAPAEPVLNPLADVPTRAKFFAAFVQPFFPGRDTFMLPDPPAGSPEPDDPDRFLSPEDNIFANVYEIIYVLPEVSRRSRQTNELITMFENSMDKVRSTEIHKVRGRAVTVLGIPGAQETWFSTKFKGREDVPQLRDMLGVPRDAKKPFKYKLWAPILFTDGVVRMSTPFSNWEPLAKVLKVILWGPTSLDHSGPPIGGPHRNARLWNATHSTPGAFAFAAIIVIYLCSPDNEFSKDGVGAISGISYKGFFDALKRILVTYWEGTHLKLIRKKVDHYIFGTGSDTSDPAPPLNEDLTDDINAALAAMNMPSESAEVKAEQTDEIVELGTITESNDVSADVGANVNGEIQVDINKEGPSVVVAPSVSAPAGRKTGRGRGQTKRQSSRSTTAAVAVSPAAAPVASASVPATVIVSDHPAPVAGDANDLGFILRLDTQQTTKVKRGSSAVARTKKSDARKGRPARIPDTDDSDADDTSTPNIPIPKAPQAQADDEDGDPAAEEEEDEEYIEPDDDLEDVDIGNEAPLVASSGKRASQSQSRASSKVSARSGSTTVIAIPPLDSDDDQEGDHEEVESPQLCKVNKGKKSLSAKRAAQVEYERPRVKSEPADSTSNDGATAAAPKPSSEDANWPVSTHVVRSGTNKCNLRGQPSPVITSILAASLDIAHQSLLITDAFPADARQVMYDVVTTAATRHPGGAEIVTRLQADLSYRKTMSSVALNRLSIYRTDVKKVAVKHTVKEYGIRPNDNKRLEELTVTNEFIFPLNKTTHKPDPGLPFQHPAVLNTLRGAFFKGPNSAGVKFRSQFTSILAGPQASELELPSPMLALAATAVRSAILDNHTDPSKRDASFEQTADVPTTYASFTKTLDRLMNESDTKYHRLMHKLLKEMGEIVEAKASSTFSMIDLDAMDE